MGTTRWLARTLAEIGEGYIFSADNRTMYKAVLINAAEGCLPGFSILVLEINGIHITWMSLLCNHFLCSTQATYLVLQLCTCFGSTTRFMCAYS